MKDEDIDMILISVSYEVTFRVRFLETDMGLFQGATVTANKFNMIYYVDRKENIKNHIKEKLESQSEDDAVLDVRVLRIEEVE